MQFYRDVNKSVTMLFFSANTFSKICFWLFSFKYWFEIRQSIDIKNEWFIFRKTVGKILCNSLLEMCVQSLKSTVYATFVLKPIKCSLRKNIFCWNSWMKKVRKVQHQIPITKIFWSNHRLSTFFSNLYLLSRQN